jgi:hemerythrin superfamily protein
MTTTSETDVVDLLLEQHQQIRRLFDEVAAAVGDEKRDRFNDLVRLLAVHESAEEIVVHPAARRAIADGDRVVEARLDEEDRAKHELAELYDLGVDDPAFDQRLTALGAAVLQHAAQEESQEFLTLRAELPPDRLRNMRGAVEAAEKMAPSRPHPGAGESASANLMAGPPLAVFDRVRDAVRDWGRSSAD